MNREIEILLFAQAKDIVGSETVNVALSSPASVQQAIEWLRNRHPAIEQTLESCMFAVNEEYCENLDIELASGDKLAVIPPVSGG